MPIINQIVKGGGGSAPGCYVEKSVDGNQKLVGGSSFIDLTGAADLGDYVLAYAYYGNTSFNGTADMSGLTDISGDAALFHAFEKSGITELDISNVTQNTGSAPCEYMCSECLSLTSVDLSSYTTLSGFSHAFYGCANLNNVEIDMAEALVGCDNMFSYSGLTDFDFGGILTINGSSELFAYCTYLSSVDASSVTSIGSYGAQYMLYHCTTLTTMSWDSLDTLGYQALYGAYAYSGIQELWFYVLSTFDQDVDPDNDPDSDPFMNMLEGVDGCTVHFPAALQSTIGNWPSVQAGFAGTNTTVLFDL